MIYLFLILALASGFIAGSYASRHQDDRMIKEARRIRDENKRIVNEYNDLKSDYEHLMKQIIKLSQKLKLEIVQ